ncbi:conjugal transfer protein TrbD [Phocoenobacter uteri]|uniref:Conjugal transfer protein TrbD n=1 Tax=Phocoenobacter uteri TaxID=146806 RepID=A0A379DEV2_9PAST|nr:conjugal transfer protein TrbD [Phocoenobacter uteri]MDG6882807.1 conjugal transfer protein TrbD [Phocoenobacter uteri]MDG6882846.1 conjugal transfer protein TrbD [Phocoenobacter uteri]SUB76409.1 conjugal transfer protein TrbD [Phocoenobacter uteri]
MQKQDVRKILIRKVGNRVSLFLGGDRELVMFTGLLAFALIFSAQTWYSTLYAIIIWFGGLFSLRKIAKADPLMRNIYIRSLKYKSFYCSNSTPFRLNTKERK